MGFSFQNIRLFSETVKRTNPTGPFTFNRKEAKIDYHFILKFFQKDYDTKFGIFGETFIYGGNCTPFFCSFRMKKKMERLKKFTVT